MKILQVLTDTNIGGAGTWLLNFLSAYDRSSFDIAVVLPTGAALVERISALGVRTIEADSIADRSFSVDGIRVLRDIFRREKPDIVHTHASLSARIVAKECGIKVVNTRHCLEEPKHGLRRTVYRIINNALSDRVIGVCRAVCENLKLDGISESKLRLIYNGISPIRKYSAEERAEARREYGIPEGVTAVGIVARLEAVKNHKMFIDAATAVADRCPDALFVIVGTGSVEDELRRQAEESGLGARIIFTGYIENVERIVNALDIHMLTSYSEAFSISLIEALCVGHPVIATDVGGNSEIVSDGINGTLIPSGDVTAAADAIERYVNSPELREKCGNSAADIVHENFTSDIMARRVEEVYRELL